MAHSEQYQEQVTGAETARGPTTATAKAVTSVSVTEAIAGAAAAVLGVLGLLGVLPVYMAAIAAIAVGAAFMIEGVGITARLNRLRDELDGGRYEIAGAGAGLAVETLGGAAGVTLGVLALLGIAPWVLIPAAAIVFGGTMLIGAGASQEIEELVNRRVIGDRELHQTVAATQGARILTGLGAGTLGILVVAGVASPVVLTLVALLALGAAEFLFGAAFGTRMGRLAS